MTNSKKLFSSLLLKYLLWLMNFIQFQIETQLLFDNGDSNHCDIFQSDKCQDGIAIPNSTQSHDSSFL